MFLKQVILRNMRSYQDQTIAFPEGIVLLSGDIGSGKSTILLAIEFALFGLLREVSGAALLRNGTNEGYVELHFELDGKELIIHRTLRRKGSVRQDSGFIETGGVRHKLTALELKSKVLELIGYPEELLTKSTSLIYRYTVYTPQEDMKRILDESADERLRILRSVFDIEKYQRVKNNAALYSKSLRERMRHYEGSLIDLEIKKLRKKESLNELEIFQKKRDTLDPLLKSLKAELDSHRARLSELEMIKKDIDTHSSKLQVSHTKRDALNNAIARLKAGIKDAETKIATLQNEILPVDDASISIGQSQDAIRKLEQELLHACSRNAEYGAERKLAQEAATKISELSTCPTCLQEVKAEHKSRIISDQKQKLREIFDKEQQLKNHADTLKKNLDAAKQELDALRKKDREFAVYKTQLSHLNDLKQRKEGMLAELSNSEKELQQLLSTIKGCEEKLHQLNPLIQGYDPLKRLLDDSLSRERDIAVEHARICERTDQLNRQIDLLAKEINDKELAKLKLERIAEMNGWLDDKFVPLIGEIERHVMAKIHEEFNDTFKRWFGTLIDDSLMSAELDDTFTPIISQNGYDTDSAFLSGGEKTACALAYRLALNKTINSLLHTIKTKDLLILDEPTDGFSDEQLDKMRDVLDDLGLRQVILVSHEQKIESFADHVIRVQKDSHISRIITS